MLLGFIFKYKINNKVRSKLNNDGDINKDDKFRTNVGAMRGEEIWLGKME